MLIPRSLINFVCVCVCVCGCGHVHKRLRSGRKSGKRKEEAKKMRCIFARLESSESQKEAGERRSGGFYDRANVRWEGGKGGVAKHCRLSLFREETKEKEK